MSKKDRKRKDPEVLKETLRNSRHEIAVLAARLDKGKVPQNLILGTELRMCKLMNETIPRTEKQLAARTGG